MTETPDVDRRTVLRSVGTVATAGVLAGCGGDSTSGAGGGSDGGDGGGNGGSGGSSDGDGDGGSGGSGDDGSDGSDSEGSGDSADDEETPAQSDGGDGDSDAPEEVTTWLSNADNFDGVVDKTGQSEVTVEVGTSANGGNFGFGPAAIRVDPGTTVVWEWTGKGGQHNVVASDGSFESKLTGEVGYTFEQRFEREGITQYFCRPHKALGMKGAIVVGGGGSGGDKTRVEQWLSNADNFEGVVDKTGQSEVTVEVGAEGNGGNFGFGPAAIRVDPGTTVVWQWTGKGGAHNVVAQDGRFKSEVTSEQGYAFERTFDSPGTTLYYCAPHKALGMKGAIVVDGTSESGGESGDTDSDDSSDGSGTGDAPSAVSQWLSATGNFDGVTDMTGQSPVVIEVGTKANGGAFGYSPAAIRIDAGTRVIWEWTGDGGSHNVVARDGSFESALKSDEGATYQRLFDSPGTALYYCAPHKSLGMKGAIIVE